MVQQTQKYMHKDMEPMLSAVFGPDIFIDTEASRRQKGRGSLEFAPDGASSFYPYEGRGWGWSPLSQAAWLQLDAPVSRKQFIADLLRAELQSAQSRRHDAVLPRPEEIIHTERDAIVIKLAPLQALIETNVRAEPQVVATIMQRARNYESDWLKSKKKLFKKASHVLCRGRNNHLISPVSFEFDSRCDPVNPEVFRFNLTLSCFPMKTGNVANLPQTSAEKIMKERAYILGIDDLVVFEDARESHWQRLGLWMSDSLEGMWLKAEKTLTNPDKLARVRVYIVEAVHVQPAAEFLFHNNFYSPEMCSDIKKRVPAPEDNSGGSFADYCRSTETVAAELMQDPYHAAWKAAVGSLAANDTTVAGFLDKLKNPPEGQEKLYGKISAFVLTRMPLLAKELAIPYTPQNMQRSVAPAIVQPS